MSPFAAFPAGPDGVTDAGGDPAGSLTFVGTATTVLTLGPFTVLTDPNFLHRGQRAYLGKGLWSRRLTEPAMAPSDLPTLDAVVLSHLHGDHFDRVARRELTRDSPVLTTPAGARRLERWGFATRALETWQSETLVRGSSRLVVRALPARHARGVVGALLPPVMGSLLELHEPGQDPFRVYVSGDTVDGPHLADIAHRHPEVDVAVVHLGGTRVLWHQASWDGEDAVRALRLLRPAVAVPVHHGDYGVFRAPLSRFLTAAEGGGLETGVVVPGRGDTVPLRRAAPATPRRGSA